MPGKDPNEFRARTKTILAQRAGYWCSFPGCNQLTIGAHSEQDRTISVGVAAHIHGARLGSKRYDPSMTPEQRRHVSNGIWMCQTHAWLIDTDEQAFPASLLRKWRADHEEQIKRAIAQGLVCPEARVAPRVELDSNLVPDDFFLQHGANRKRELLVGLFPLTVSGSPIDSRFEARFRALMRDNPSIQQVIMGAEMRGPDWYELKVFCPNTFGPIPVVWRVYESGTALFVRSTEDPRVALPGDNPGYWSIPDCIFTSVAVVSTQLAFATSLFSHELDFVLFLEAEATGMIPTFESALNLPGIPTSGKLQRLHAKQVQRVVLSSSDSVDETAAKLAPMWMRILRTVAGVCCNMPELQLFLRSALSVHSPQPAT